MHDRQGLKSLAMAEVGGACPNVYRSLAYHRSPSFRKAWFRPSQACKLRMPSNVGASCPASFIPSGFRLVESSPLESSSSARPQHESMMGFGPVAFAPSRSNTIGQSVARIALPSAGTSPHNRVRAGSGTASAKSLYVTTAQSIRQAPRKAGNQSVLRPERHVFKNRRSPPAKDVRTTPTISASFATSPCQ